jgi:hypothetical protein
MTPSVLTQWDVVRVRILPEDRDEHPAVLISPPEVCADPQKRRVNVLYGTTRRPAQAARAHEIILNGADGLDHATMFSCAHIYTVERALITARLGEVSRERRRQLGRAIVATYRLPLA